MFSRPPLRLTAFRQPASPLQRCSPLAAAGSCVVSQPPPSACTSCTAAVISSMRSVTCRLLIVQQRRLRRHHVQIRVQPRLIPRLRDIQIPLRRLHRHILLLNLLRRHPQRGRCNLPSAGTPSAPSADTPQHPRYTCAVYCATVALRSPASKIVSAAEAPSDQKNAGAENSVVIDDDSSPPPPVKLSVG